MAKGYIFSADEKLAAAQRRLKNEVRAFNRRVEQAVKSGKIPKSARPETASYQEIMRYSIDQGATTKEKTKAIKAAADALAATAKPGALDIVKAGGAEVTRYGLQLYKKAAKKAEAGRQEAQAEIDRIKKHGKQTGGRLQQNIEHLKEKASYPVPKVGSDLLKTSGDFLKWARRFEQKFSPNEWINYKENLIKNINKNVKGRSNRSKLARFAQSLSPNQIQTLYENMTENLFISQDSYYEKEMIAKETISQACGVLGIAVPEWA